MDHLKAVQLRGFCETGRTKTSLTAWDGPAKRRSAGTAVGGLVRGHDQQRLAFQSVDFTRTACNLLGEDLMVDFAYADGSQHWLEVIIANHLKKTIKINVIWRTVRDSNPRDGSPPTHFPGVRLRPLGQLSVRHSIRVGNQRRKGPAAVNFAAQSSRLIVTRRFWRPFFSILPISTRPISAVRATWVPPQGCRSTCVGPAPIRTSRTRPCPIGG